MTTCTCVGSLRLPIRFSTSLRKPNTFPDSYDQVASGSDLFFLFKQDLFVSIIKFIENSLES